MKLNSFFVLLLCCTFFSNSCKKESNDSRISSILSSEKGFPKVPANLSIINSEYDDYNSNITIIADYVLLAFSSNRNSKGGDFDIVLKGICVNYDDVNQIAKIWELDSSAVYSYDIYPIIENMLPAVNTTNNEFGPYLFQHDLAYGFARFYPNKDFLFFYAQDTLGQLDLKFMTYETDSVVSGKDYYTSQGPFAVNCINTATHNEAYISISDNHLYYCSDSDGNFDIYELEFDGTNIKDFLTQGTSLQSKAKKIISSSKDDKCPYVVGNCMVFTSNRDGGQGGFDLWYSKKIDNQWSEPVNFGPEINTPSDEYRPILGSYYPSFPNDLMIFSSNREGGMGGFDLYYMGVNIAR